MNTQPSDAQSSAEEQVPPPGTPSPDIQPPTHFEREDDRWALKAQLRDWWILALMIITYLVWTGIVYFLEPGIR
jgi:hypothetical protein